MRSHSSCLFDTGQSLLMDFDLCASTRLVFFDTGQPLSVDFGICAPTRLVFFRLISRWSVAVGGLWLVRFHSSFLFDAGQPLSADFDLCASTRLVFLTLVSSCRWTLTCALPLVLSFSLWSVAVGGLWLVRFPVGGLWLLRTHSSCLFDAGQSLFVDFDLCASTRLVFFHTGQPLLVDFGLCAPTRLVFMTLVSRCWRTLACAQCMETLTVM